jgi:hypothetical protein
VDRRQLTGSSSDGNYNSGLDSQLNMEGEDAIDEAPPAYSDSIGHIQMEENGMSTDARIAGKPQPSIGAERIILIEQTTVVSISISARSQRDGFHSSLVQLCAPSFRLRSMTKDRHLLLMYPLN